MGFEAHGQGKEAGEEHPATVLNSLMAATRAGGGLGIPGLYVTDDPGAEDPNAKTSTLGIRIGLGWAKSHFFQTGQCPVMKYNRQLMMASHLPTAAFMSKVGVAIAKTCWQFSLTQLRGSRTLLLRCLYSSAI